MCLLGIDNLERFLGAGSFRHDDIRETVTIKVIKQKKNVTNNKDLLPVQFIYASIEMALT